MNDMPSKDDLSKEDRKALEKLAKEVKKMRQDKIDEESKANYRPKFLAVVVHRMFRHGLPMGWGR